MNNSFIQKNRFIQLSQWFFAVVFVTVLLTCKGSTAYAASLYFEPQDITAGTEKEFIVAVDVTAENPVNAFDITLSIPDAFTPTEIVDGNSVINFWIEHPVFNPDTHILSFSGIVPGGFSGNAGRLVTLKLKVNKAQENTNFSFIASSTSVVLNGPAGQKDELTLTALNIPVVPGKENIVNKIPDFDPPLDFVPTLFHDQTINNGAWMLAFSTQDKGTGIGHYEIQETSSNDYSDYAWLPAESPYVLHDQRLHKNIFVKAIDNNGNEKIMGIKAPYGVLWWKTKNGIITILTVLLILFLLCYEVVKLSKNKNENV